jgi:hypothetical protein
MNKNVKLLGITAMLSMTFAACSNDELVESYQGEEISFTTRVTTRATETKLENLESFYVYADAPNYNMFLDKVQATKKEPGKAIYTLPDNKYWPSGVKQFNFWAYGPCNLELKEGEPQINTTSQTFSDFTPKAKGEDQQDFVVAYTEAERDKVPGMAVPLTFHHALSQVEIIANCPDADKNIYIKGAWIVNVKKSGTLSFSKEVGENGNYMQWNASSSKTQYGIVFDQNAKVVAKSAENNIKGTTLIGNSNNNSGLMLVPQTTDELKFTTVGEGDNKVVTGDDGTYILILCRIEAIHDGANHDGDDTTVKVEGNKHIHQLFPINPTSSFVQEQYGYTCVPVALNWTPGKKYIYNLEFCGHESGGGIYPAEIPAGLPSSPDGGDIIKDLPKGKYPGDLVLDNPITFTVGVAEWTPADKDEDTPMN